MPCLFKSTLNNCSSTNLSGDDERRQSQLETPMEKFAQIFLPFVSCLSIEMLRFSFSLRRYYCHSNRIHIGETDISPPPPSLRCSRSDFFLPLSPCADISTFSPLCLIKLCVNCVRFHRMSLVLMLFEKKADGVSPCVFTPAFFPLASSSSFKYFESRRRKSNPQMVIKFPMCKSGHLVVI